MREFSSYIIEPERYELAEEVVELTRRQLLKALGGGLLVLAMGPSLALQGRGSGSQASQEIAAWVHIGTDGKVTVFCGKAEVGQNARTSVTQAAAEELRISATDVVVTLADTSLSPFDQGTFGSRTTPSTIPIVRRAAATARELLLDSAASKLSVEKASLTAEGGKVRSASGMTLTYGELAAITTWDKPISAEVPLTDVAAWKTLGKSIPKVDGRAFVTGSHQFASDISLPGMLHAKVLRPPNAGASLASADLSAAEAMPGVRVVRDGSFVAVAAPTLRLAEQALFAIKAEWEESPQPSSKELFSLLRGSSAPNAGAPPRRAAKMHAATYTTPYIAHVPLEPRAAVAQWDGTRATVHTGTQRPFGVRQEVARALGISEENVRVIVPDTGSGYGGKHTGDAAVEAARIARAIGKPVKVVWTRQEEFAFAYFRPAGVVEIASGVGDDGTLAFWEMDNYNSGGSGLATPYAVPNPRTTFHQAQSPLRQGSYRALAATFNTFARESHMDELAHLANVEPLEFRLRNLRNERLLAVLKEAAEKFGWGKSPATSSRGYGIACGVEKGSYIASAVEVAIERASNGIRVTRVVSAYECGAALHPAHLKNQVEGAIIMGLGGALFEAIDFDSGRILTDRFSRYRLPRFSDVPIMETHILNRPDLPSAGAGETPIIAVAPAIGNAVFSATGTRLRSMPLELT